MGKKQYRHDRKGDSHRCILYEQVVKDVFASLDMETRKTRSRLSWCSISTLGCLHELCTTYQLEDFCLLVLSERTCSSILATNLEETVQ